MIFPSVSIVIPTRNSAHVLKDCLNSIKNQDYDKKLLEVIIIDADSADETISIAKQFNVDKILKNPLKTGEAGKAIGFSQTKNDIIAFIDSDNILDRNDWLKKIVEPFNDDEIIASEPLWYTYRKEDKLITRYCALLGMNDPVCLFLGNYDRMSTLTGKWTEMPVNAIQEQTNYLKVALDTEFIPTIGANGFLVRRDALQKCNIGDYLFDIDIISQLITMNHKVNGINCYKIAKVKCGIVHIFSGNLMTFAKKQHRRVRDFITFSRKNLRTYKWNKFKKLNIAKFILYSILIFPLIGQTTKGMLKKFDIAWTFHPIACLLTLFIYSSSFVKNFIKK